MRPGRPGRALRPGGWHYASFTLGDGEGRCRLGRWHNFPTAQWIAGRYRDAGFAIEATEKYRGQGADGVQRDWYALTLRRAA